MTNRKLNLTLDSSCAYDGYWPYIEIVINSEIKYSDYINKKILIEIDFVSLDKNNISIFYKNKRVGPDVWDTIIDNDGNIIRDQYILIDGIKIDECNLNFLIPEISFETSAGELIKTNGFIGFNGVYKIAYSEPYYEWVHKTRLQLLKNVQNNSYNSSLPYITNYVYEYNNEEITRLVNQFQDAVNAAKNIGSINTVSRTP